MLRLGNHSARFSGGSTRWLRIRSSTRLSSFLPHRSCRISQQYCSHPLLIPRFAFQCRLLSHKTTETQNGNLFSNNKEVAIPDDDTFTNLILSSALGTLSASQIDETFQMIAYWKNTNSGYGIDSADRLLQRLIYEQAASPLRVRNHYPLLFEWQGKLFESWFQFSNYPLALERAENILLRLIDWKSTGVATVDLTTSDKFVKLVESWLSLPSNHTSRGLERATQLLLWWTDDPSSASSASGGLVPLFHKALTQCIELERKSLAQELLVRMGDLQTIEEWQGIEPETSLWKSVSSMPSSSSRQDEKIVVRANSGVALSAEGTVIRRLLFSFLETAKPGDADQVEEFAQQYQPLAITPEAREELFFAVAEYYAQIRNVVKATQWIQKIDPATCSDKAWLGEALTFLLRLWADETSPEAPWRAYEILQRLEAIDTTTIASYSIVTEMWLSSSELSAERKAKQLFSKIIEFFPSGHNHPAPDIYTTHIMLKHPQEFRGLVPLKDLATVFVEGCDHFPKRLLPEMTQNLLRALAGQKVGTWAHRVVKLTAVGEILTTKMCETALMAQAGSHHPRHVEYLLTYLKQHYSEILSFHCYSIAAGAMANEFQPESFEFLKSIIRDVASRMSSGDFEVVPEEFVSMIVGIVKALRKATRPQEADEILQLVESLFIQPESLTSVNEKFFSIRSYDHVIEAWFVAHRYDKAEETMDRVFNLYRSGLSTVMPTTFTFSKIMKYYREQSGSTDKVLEWFGRMVQLYHETNSEDCKPDLVAFNAVLQSLSESAAAATCQQAMEIFEIMPEIGISPDNFSFNYLLKSFLKSNNAYHDVTNLVKRMNEFDLQPDKYTALVVLDACAMASLRNRESALATATQCLGHARQLGRPLFGHYLNYFAVLDRLLSHKDPRFEPLVLSAFQLCVSDGYGEKAGFHLRSLVSNETWVKINSEVIVKHNPTTQVHPAEVLQHSCEQPQNDGKAVVPELSNSLAAASVRNDFAIIFSLALSEKQERFEVTRQLLTQLVQRMSAGDSQVEQAEFDELVNSVVNAFVKQRHSQEAETVLLMLDEMHDQWTGDASTAKPMSTIDAYNTLINNWCFQFGNIEKAQSLLDRVCHRYCSGDLRCLPTRSTFKPFLQFFHRNIDKNVYVDRASEYLDQMIQFYEETKYKKCKPTKDDFRKLLRAFADQPEREDIHLRALAYFNQQVQLGVMPDLETFNHLLKIIVKNEKHSYQSVIDIVLRLREMELLPNENTSLFMLQSCLTAQPQDREAALTTAMDVLSQHHKSGTTMQAMYQLFFPLLDTVVDKNDSRYGQLLEWAFRMCWQDGYHIFAEQELKEKMDPSMWDRLTNDSDGTKQSNSDHPQHLTVIEPELHLISLE